MPAQLPLIVRFDEIDRDDISLVGGKGANLGEMTKAGFPVPPGFIVTSHAYYRFLDETGLQKKLKAYLAGLDVKNTGELTRISQQIRVLINRTPIPPALVTPIMAAYLKLGRNVPVAVRSSATAEDLPTASFAGQQDTFLNVVGEANVVNNVRNAWSSLFTPRAIFYRQQQHYDHLKVGIAIPVQKMVAAESSGVMFTINPVNNDKSVIVVEAILGLGELIVQGSVTPDHYEVLKRTMEISKKDINRQKVMMVRKKRGFEMRNEIRPVPGGKQESQKVQDRVILTVAKLGLALQQHYFFPQDSEWAVQKGRVYLIQTRPITTIPAVDRVEEQTGAATKGLELLTTGSPASPGLVTGPAIVIRSIKEINKVKPGNILVMEMTTPDFVPAMKKVVGIVTDQGGQTSHAAIVSRELGVACVVGAGNATKKIQTGTVVTVNGVTGEVFRGAIVRSGGAQVQSSVKDKSEINLETLKTATKLYVNLAESEHVERVAAESVDGIGLLRAEFMIAQIGIHPKKMIRDGRSRNFIDQLTANLTAFAAAFDPRPVVYRATDFRTNEYRNLKGGELYEPEEPNPMLGYRGAFRYMKDPEVFDLELRAITDVRKRHQNLHLMIPFVRSVRELREVKKLVYASGLRRSHTFQLWMMAELPVNVISIDDFIAVGIDGISIGTNDLTMLTLGTDRDNEEVASEYSELNPAVLWSLKRLITASKKAGVTSSICGQAPSIYPDLTEKLVKWGITSISVSPDRIQATRRLIYEAEKRLIRK